MGRPSKTVTKKTSEKDNKTVVEATVAVEKKEEDTITNDSAIEDEVSMSSANKEETSNNTEDIDKNKEETVEITPQKDSDGNTDSTKEEVVTNENKVSTEETIAKKPRRWMKDVYGYNWNGQCFDE